MASLAEKGAFREHPNGASNPSDGRYGAPPSSDIPQTARGRRDHDGRQRGSPRRGRATFDLQALPENRPPPAQGGKAARPTAASSPSPARRHETQRESVRLDGFLTSRGPRPRPAAPASGGGGGGWGGGRGAGTREGGAARRPPPGVPPLLLGSAGLVAPPTAPRGSTASSPAGSQAGFRAGSRGPSELEQRPPRPDRAPGFVDVPLRTSRGRRGPWTGGTPGAARGPSPGGGSDKGGGSDARRGATRAGAGPEPRASPVESLPAALAAARRRSLAALAALPAARRGVEEMQRELAEWRAASQAAERGLADSRRARADAELAAASVALAAADCKRALRGEGEMAREAREALLGALAAAAQLLGSRDLTRAVAAEMGAQAPPRLSERLGGLVDRLADAEQALAGPLTPAEEAADGDEDGESSSGREDNSLDGAAAPGPAADRAPLPACV